MADIFHIADRESWNKSFASGLYFHPSLELEGFIHCSTREQLAETANLYFADEQDILVLRIDPSKLSSPLKSEVASRGVFPHIFGPINIDCVIDTATFRKSEFGEFEISYL